MNNYNHKIINMNIEEHVSLYIDKIYKNNIEKEIIKKSEETKKYLNCEIKDMIMKDLRHSDNYDYRKLTNMVDMEMIKNIFYDKDTFYTIKQSNFINDSDALKMFTQFENIINDPNTFLNPTEKVFTIYFYKNYIKNEQRSYPPHDYTITFIPDYFKCLKLSDIKIINNERYFKLHLDNYRRYNGTFTSDIADICIIVTNYGRVIKILQGGVTVKEYNIWLPLDYIDFIRMTKPIDIMSLFDELVKTFYIRSYQQSIEDTKIGDKTLIHIQTENIELIKKLKDTEKELCELKIQYQKIVEENDIRKNKLDKMKDLF